MFGYVVVHQPELKIKEFEIYKGYYCGLCHTLLKRHGISGQMTLTYDMTFLAMLLSSLYEAEVFEESRRCLIHPARKHRCIRTVYTDYVADMNLLLSYYKAKDDWNDDHSLLKLAFSKMIQKHAIKNQSMPDTQFISYEIKADKIASLLNELNILEKQKISDIDVMAGIFGSIMAVLFEPKEDLWSASLKKIGFFLGKFIYILDAYDDLEKDRKRGNYNPFYELSQKPDFDAQIHSMLTMMIAESTKAFEYLPVLDNAEILRNIMYAGVWQKYYNIRERRLGAKNE